MMAAAADEIAAYWRGQEPEWLAVLSESRRSELRQPHSRAPNHDSHEPLWCSVSGTQELLMLILREIRELQSR